MKKLFTSSFFLISSNLLAQNAYYDAKFLRSLYNETTNTIVTVTTEDEERFNAILDFYSYDKDEINPFLDPLIGDGRPSGTDKTTKPYNKLISSAGGLNVATFADGLAQFMIERANEEVNVWFFRKFKQDLDKSIELKTIFPTTNSFIQITEPYQYAQNLHLLREAFKKDLVEIVDNLENLTSLEKYKNLILKVPELKVILVGLAGASIVSNIKNGTHPADVIDSLGSREYLEDVDKNLFSGLRVLSILSQSLRNHPDSSNLAYVEYNSFKSNILSDNIAYKIYLGLLYQKFDNINFITRNDTTTVQDILRENKEEILSSSKFGFGFISKLNVMDQKFDDLKQKKDTIELKYLEWYNFYESVLDIVEFGIDGSNIFPIHLGDKTSDFKTFIFAMKMGNNIFRNVNEKNYSLAILNFSVLYDTLVYKPIRRNQSQINAKISSEIVQLSSKSDSYKAWYVLSPLDDRFSLNEEKSQLTRFGESVDLEKALKEFYNTKSIDEAIKKFQKQSKDFSIASSKFIKYGAFMAAVADAEKPEDVKAALNAAALPAGSSSIKRQTPFNVSVNSYLGFHLGEEKLDGKGWGNIQGVSAPVGIAASLQLNKPFNGGSLSLFGSVIDIGAVASFRLTNDAGVETLPEMKLQNIIAPGAYIIYGIPNAPISIGYGWQRGPQLRGIATTTAVEGVPTAVTYDMVNGYRWTFFVAMDIPLFNLYTKSK